MEDRSAKLNGYKPRSYGDIVAVATLLAMLLSVVAWGLKLEGELNAVREDTSILRAQVGNGILPRSEERIRAIDKELVDIRRELREHQQDDHR